MEEILREEVRNSALYVPKEKRAFLTYPAEGLAFCSLDELEDGVAFLFDTTGLAPVAEMWDKTWDEKLRFLINCADLEKLCAEYTFSLSPKNLMLDLNLRPRVLLRDMRQDGADFLPQYKALIGSLLRPKYGYEDYLNGGQDLYKKNKLLVELSALETATEIKSRLTEVYAQEVETIRTDCCRVTRRSRRLSRITIPILIVLLGVAGFFTVRSLVFDVPHRDTLLAANTAYIADNHLDVQRIMVDIALEDMDVPTRYLLSRSYVITEPLTDAQRRNVLMGLTQLTDPVLFDYWILLGRLYLDEAIDLAQRLGDNELLLFALLKKEAVVRADTIMPGDEKVALLSSLERQIADLQRARDEAVAE